MLNVKFSIKIKMDELFSEINLRNIKIKNRIVRSATHDYMGNEDGTVSENEVNLYKEFAKNNIGLIISAHVCVAEQGKASKDQNCFFDDRFIAPMQKAANAVKSLDSKFIIQISHAGGKSKPTYNGGQTPIAPSALELIPHNVLPKEMTLEDIKNVENDFVAAAVRAKKSDADGIQLHCAHGYLLSQFISPVHNKRTDIYGGSIENRFRIVKEIIVNVQASVGTDFPMFVKINSNVEENDDKYEGDLLYMLREFEQLGISAVELSGCNFTDLSSHAGPYFIERAAKMRKQVNVPIILVGGIKSIDDMENVLSNNIDMVSLSRPLICEPDLITKFRLGTQNKAKCISCNKCFSLFKKQGKRCVFE